MTDQFIADHYFDLQKGIYAKDLVKVKPVCMTDRQLFKEMNKKCVVTRRNGKTFYRLSDTNVVLYDPFILRLINAGKLDQNEIDLIIAFHITEESFCLKKATRERKMEVLFYYLFVQSMTCYKREYNNLPYQVTNIFKDSPRETWEVKFLYCARLFKPIFEEMTRCKIKDLEYDFHNDFTKALEIMSFRIKI